ncbi:hypothetical protein AB0N14_26110 [Streptomyces sp. NPDC051104]
MASMRNGVEARRFSGPHATVGTVTVGTVTAGTVTAGTVTAGSGPTY